MSEESLADAVAMTAREMRDMRQVRPERDISGDETHRVWQARAALLMALPEVCAPQLQALQEDLRRWRRFRDSSRGGHSDRGELAIVTKWVGANGLAGAERWLIPPVCSIVSWRLNSAITAPGVWRDQIWQVEGFRNLEREKIAIRENWLHPKAPKPDSEDRETWLRISREWAERSVPRQPIEADPTAQGRAAFLAFAAAHYDARAADLEADGWAIYRDSNYLADEAKWTLRRYVLGDSPSAIGSSMLESARVRKAIERFAKLAGMGEPHPAHRRKRSA